MTATVCLPATEVISIDAMASVDTVVWRAGRWSWGIPCLTPTSLNGVRPRGPESANQFGEVPVVPFLPQWGPATGTGIREHGKTAL